MSSQIKNSISVVLPNYNGSSLLAANIPSIITSLNTAKCEYEIIVVDDCSSDDSVSMLQNHFPEVIIIQNEINQGFSGTCNRGVFAAKLPLVCICSTDVTLEADYFLNALPHFQNQNLFALKGNIVNYTFSFDNIMNTEKTSQLFFKRGFYRFNNRVEYDFKPLTGKLHEQFVLLGCVFLCDREKMLQLKGFDEIFSPFYWEDSDLAIRALRRGYNVVYEPNCVVYHQTSATISNYRSYTKRRLISMRNKFLFSWRHMNDPKLWITHISYTLISLLTRWIILDWKYYVAFFTALIRIKRL
jgi:GT2 family glycosyltransferase